MADVSLFLLYSGEKSSLRSLENGKTYSDTHQQQAYTFFGTCDSSIFQVEESHQLSLRI